MSQQQRVDAGRVEAEWRIVRLILLAAALEHAAVDQHATAVAGNQMAGAGDLLGRTMAAVFDAWIHVGASCGSIAVDTFGVPHSSFTIVATPSPMSICA